MIPATCVPCPKGSPPLPRGEVKSTLATMRDAGTAVDGAIPALPRAYVHRLRLWEHLDGADSGAATVLIGPAGAGKTLGVSGWLRLHRPPGDTAWITADAGWTPDRLRDVLDRGVRVVVDDAHRLPAGSLALIDDPWLFGSFRDRMAGFVPWLEFSNVIPVSFEELVGARGGGDDATQRRLIWSLQLKLHVPGSPG